MKFHNIWTFASDAELAIVWGLGFVAIAGVAMLAERRRVRRKHIDTVGCMPWTAVFLASALVGGTLVVMGLMGLLKG